MIINHQFHVSCLSALAASSEPNGSYRLIKLINLLYSIHLCTFKDTMTSASIRYNNPGAMWDCSIAQRWGSDQHVTLSDGEANHIAIFPDPIHGAAAQFDLWRHDYCNLSLSSAIYKWSGHNSSAPYMEFLCKNTGLEPSSTISEMVLSGPIGLKLMKAQARWEAGTPYPLSDEDWGKAQSLVFGGCTTVSPKPIIPSTSSIPSIPVTQRISQSPNLLSSIWNFLSKH